MLRRHTIQHLVTAVDTKSFIAVRAPAELKMPTKPNNFLFEQQSVKNTTSWANRSLPDPRLHQSTEMSSFFSHLLHAQVHPYPNFMTYKTKLNWARFRLHCRWYVGSARKTVETVSNAWNSWLPLYLSFPFCVSSSKIVQNASCYRSRLQIRNSKSQI